MTSTTLHSLVARGLFSDGDSSDTCRSFSADSQAEPISGSLTFHKLMTYIGAAAMGICCISTFTMILCHIFTYRQPRVQKQLIRMIFIMPVFAIFCFFGILSYRLTPYFIPIAQLYEAFALIAVFYLMVAMLTPNASTWSEQHAFFSQPANGGVANFVRTYIAVMQLLPVRVITTIAIMILSGVDCVGGKHYKRGHTIIGIVNAISAAVALVALLRFLKKWIRQLKAVDGKIVGKLACFKLIVAIELIQTLVFRILSQTNALNATRTHSWNDLNLGLPALLLTIEAAILGLGMVWFYWHGQFRHHGYVIEAGKDGQPTTAPPSQKLSPLRAVWDAVDLLDVLAGMYRAVKLYAGRGRGGRSYAQQASPHVPQGQPQQHQGANPTYQAYHPPARGH